MRGGDVGNGGRRGGRRGADGGGGELVRRDGVGDAGVGERSEGGSSELRRHSRSFEVSTERAAELGIGGDFFGERTARAGGGEEAIDRHAKVEEMIALRGDGVVDHLCERLGSACGETDVGENALGVVV